MVLILDLLDSNIIYKMVSKVLANWLKQILTVIIFKNQSAFLPECLITDNIIIAYEALYFMKIRQKLGCEGSMVIKLDISKTYDKLEWIFLEVMMCKLGYNDVWISMIMTCVTTFSYSVLVHG